MKTIQTFLFLAAAVVLASCGGGSFQKTKSGLLYKVIADGKGQQLKPGDYIKLHVIVKQKDSITFNSYGKVPAYTMIDSGRTYDISEMLPKLKVGDSAVVVQLADSIAKQQMGQFPPGLNRGDKITFTFRILGVFKDMAAFQADVQKEMDIQKEREIAVLEKHLKSKGINAVKSPKGALVEIIEPGTGAKPDSGKQVSLKYTGTNLEGKKFDSNVDTTFGHTDPLQFVIGQMGMIPGFEEGAKLLMKGGKARVYVPSMLGYGMQGRAPSIQPYENLVFEIELLDITDAPKQQAPPVVPTAPAAGEKK